MPHFVYCEFLSVLRSNSFARISPRRLPVRLVARWARFFAALYGSMPSARLMILVAACLMMHPAAAQVTGISYTLTPLAERIFFDRDAGLSDGTFVGGRLGFGFGEFTELSGVYLASTRLRTSFDNFADLGEEQQDRFEMLPSRSLHMRQMGASLKFNLGRAALFPFVSVGTGVLQFDPENMDDSQVIYLTGAAGLQLALGDHFGLLFQVRDLAYRYNPASVLLSSADLADLGVPVDDFRQVNVHNLALRVGLQMYAGGRARGELTAADRALRDQFSSGLSGIRLQVEPVGGMIDFDEELGYRERQRMAGVQAGIDLGPYLGLRSFYWRGLREGALTDFDDLQAYGGEVKLRFGGGVAPHLLIGGGYLDVLEGYEGLGAMQPVDRPFAYGGAGVALPITRAIRLHGGVRTLLLSAEDAADVSDPSHITTNFLYSAGISFGVGRGDARRPAAQGRVREHADFAHLQRQIDSLAIAQELVRRPGPVTPSTDTAAVLQESAEGRWISIPLPDRGEVYLRFGEPGSPRVVYVDPETGAVVRSPGAASVNPAPGAAYVDPETGAVVRAYVDPATGAVVRPPGDGDLSAAEIQAIVRDAVRRELSTTGDRDVEAVSESERRLLDRIADLERRLAARERDVAASDDRRVRAVSADRRLAAAETRGGYEFRSLMPFVGVGFSEDQIAVVGLRGDLRSRSLAGARFLPELVAAAGADGPSYGLNAAAAFPLGFQILSLRPYAGLGLGLITTGGPELVFNLLAGVEQAGLQGRFFAEYMSQDFFDLNRVIVGYRLSF